MEHFVLIHVDVFNPFTKKWEPRYNADMSCIEGNYRLCRAHPLKYRFFIDVSNVPQTRYNYYS